LESREKCSALHEIKESNFDRSLKPDLNSVVNKNKNFQKNIIDCENRDHECDTKYSPFTDYFSKIIKIIAKIFTPNVLSSY
jgi:hypothetical protein